MVRDGSDASLGSPGEPNNKILLDRMPRLYTDVKNERVKVWI